VARVFFADHLMQYTAGTRELELRGERFRDLVAQLENLFPGISEILIGKVAVAIDGDIIHDPFLEPVGPDSEVYFLHRIEGG
jgi:sulfur-carrier protein